MDVSFLVTVVGAVLGTALIVAGWVVYRNGEALGSKVFGAVSIAVGAVLWIVVVFITPVSVTQGG